MCSGRLVSIAAGERHRLDAGLQSLRVAGIAEQAVHDVLRGIARFCLAAAPVAEHGGPKTRQPQKGVGQKRCQVDFSAFGRDIGATCRTAAHNRYGSNITGRMHV